MPVDFFVGALMTIYSQAFKIHKCDQYAPNFMEENCGAFPMADGLLGAVILLGAVGLEYDSTSGSAIRACIWFCPVRTVVRRRSIR